MDGYADAGRVHRQKALRGQDVNAPWGLAAPDQVGENNPVE